MIGDVIGKPGRVAVEQRAARHPRRARASTSSPPTARTSPAAWASPSSTAEALFARRRRRDHVRQPHLGQARDLPVPRHERARPAAAQLRHPRGPGPRLGHVPGARRLRARGDQPPGPDVHAADREPVHGRRPAARRGVRAAAADPARRLPLRADVARRTRSGCTSTGGSASSSARTPTSSPATSGSCPRARPTRPTSGMTGPCGASSGSTPTTVLPRFINALPTRFEVGDGPGRPQRLPDRHRPGDRPGAPDRADPAPGRGLMATSGSARHAPRPEDGEPFTPGDAVADVHAHTTRSDGVLEPASSSARRTTPASGCSRSPTTTTSPAYRELVAPGAPPLPAGPRRSSRQSRSTPSTRGLGPRPVEGELHVLGIGVDPTDDAFEAALAGQRGARRTAVRRDGRAAARDRACRSTPRSRRLDLTARRRAGPADGRPRARRGRVTPRASRTRSTGSSSHGQPGYVPRTGLGPVEAIHAIRAAGGLASLAHFWQAPNRISLLRDLIAEGLDGLESHHRSFDPEARDEDRRHGACAGPRRDRRHGLPRRHGPVRGSHAGLVMPDALVAGLRTRLASTRAGA